MKTVRKGDGLNFKFLEQITYVIFVLLGFYLAFLLRYDFNPQPHNIKPFFDNIVYIIIAAAVIFSLYDITTTFKKSLFENVIIIIISLILIDTITMAIVFFNRGFTFPRSVFILGFIIQFVLIFTTKYGILMALRLAMKKEEIIIIASREEAEGIVKSVLLDKSRYDSVRYICEVDKETYKLIDIVDKVYVGSKLSDEDRFAIIKYCSAKKKTIYLVPSFFELSLVNFKISQASDLLLFKIESLGLTYEQKLVKRMLDLIISCLGLLVLSPLLIIVSTTIKLYDRGPVFFKQERITSNSKLFKLYKFRTMVVDAEKNTGPVLATEEDPRITPLGRLLRTSRIDELPQLFNVLKGDMSIVGPRPERPFFAERFNEEVEGYKYRVLVKAGITGLAQVMGKYTTEPTTKAKYDLLYIKRYSLLFDIKIIFNTVKIMFMKDSSVGIAMEKDLDQMLSDMHLKAYKELGATRIDP